MRRCAAMAPRMATLSESGLITDAVVDDEMARLSLSWLHGRVALEADALIAILGEERAAQLGRFETAQLREVIAVCRSARSLSYARRQLFAVSCAAKTKPNDADRLKKYLARFDLDWEQAST